MTRLFATSGARGEIPAALDRRCLPPGPRRPSAAHARPASPPRPAGRAPRRSRRDARFRHGRLAAGLLLIAAPAFAAQPPDAGAPGAGLVRVETLELEPTVVKTGDRITQRYRLRFPDLIPNGREIIILEDRMTPEALPVHPFEAVSLVVEKDRIDDTHVWDFVYGFRLVDPNKMTYVLPNFSFYYLVRDLGEDIEDAEVQQVDGGQGLVRYVTSITDEPLLDIRDTIELGTFEGLATFFRTLAWVVAPLPLLLWFVMLVRFARKPKAVSIEKQQEEDELARIEAQIPVPPSIWEARRTVNRELAALRRLPRDTGADQLAGRPADARAGAARLPAGGSAGPAPRRHRPGHPAARRRAEGPLSEGGARGDCGPARRLSAGARGRDGGAGRAPGRRSAHAGRRGVAVAPARAHDEQPEGPRGGRVSASGEELAPQG